METCIIFKKLFATHFARQKRLSGHFPHPSTCNPSSLAGATMGFSRETVHIATIVDQQPSSSRIRPEFPVRRSVDQSGLAIAQEIVGASGLSICSRKMSDGVP
jgi:hypothetical protein